MRFLPFTSICLALSTASVIAEDPAREETLETLTFYVAGVECPACVFAVNDSVRRLAGIDEVIDGQNNASFINVTFDPAKVSAHQIAQAVTDAFPLHGAPYLASVRLVVPGYAEGGNAAKVAGVFAKWKDRVDLEVAKAGTGELVVRFRPLASDPAKPEAQGWSHRTLLEAIPGVVIVKEG